MPRSAETTRKHILDAAYREFRRKGYARVGVDEIAAAAKITKRTLYYHFKSKDELLATVLETQHEIGALAWDGFEKLAHNPRALIEKMYSDLFVWTSKPRWPGSGFTRLATELADLPGHPARAIARRHKELVERRLAECLAAGGVSSAKLRAREIWMLTEGAMTCILIHGNPEYANAAKRLALRLIGTPRPKRRAVRKAH